jgi:hypothetical protein
VYHQLYDEVPRNFPLLELVAFTDGTILPDVFIPEK